MKTVLVTGGNGFIGRYVCEELISRHYLPVVFDTRWRHPGSSRELVLGDVRDATSVTEAAAHVDGIIHLAGVLGTQETIANPRPAAETNVLGGLNVLEASAQYDLPMVNIAVGNYWMNNTYSITKNTVERFADMMNRFRGTRISVVRALNAYGPRQSAAEPYGPSKVRKIMPSFICRALSGEAIEIYGDGEQVMDMIYVADVARILVEALLYTETYGPIVVEAGSGIPTTVNDIADVVVAAVNKQTEIRHLPMRPGEDERSVVLGKPETLAPLQLDGSFTTFEDGVEMTVEYFRKVLQEPLAIAV